MSSVGSWLTGILKHKIIDYHRRSHFFVDLGDDSDIFDETGHWHDGAAPRAWNNLTPENDLENRRLAGALQNALAAIPKKFSTVFVLHEVEGLNRNEICELLGLSDSNYWVTLYRARLRLRHEVERRWPVNEVRSPTTFDRAVQAV